MVGIQEDDEDEDENNDDDRSSNVVPSRPSSPDWEETQTLSAARGKGKRGRGARGGASARKPTPKKSGKADKAPRGKKAAASTSAAADRPLVTRNTRSRCELTKPHIWSFPFSLISLFHF